MNIILFAGYELGGGRTLRSHAVVLGIIIAKYLCEIVTQIEMALFDLKRHYNISWLLEKKVFTRKGDIFIITSKNKVYFTIKIIIV